MAKIIKNDLIHTKVESFEFEQDKRDYIGYSGIGSKCVRKLWYDFRHTYKRKIPLRVKRLFDKGHNEEVIIIRDLERAGMVVTWKQKEVVNEFFPQIKGHIDGVVTSVPGYPVGTEMLLEMKTANHSRFEKIKKQGVKLFDNAYWTQIQCYMSELHLDKCLYVVTNKNNEERLYLVYDYDPTCVTDVAYIAKDILSNDDIPMKIGSSIWWECKMCDAYEICQGTGDIFENCHNCKHCERTQEPLENGIKCHKFKSSVNGNCFFPSVLPVKYMSFGGGGGSYTINFDGDKCSSYEKLEVLE